MKSDPPKNFLIAEILKSLKNTEGWGSVEIFVQDSKVVQITARTIKKTRHPISEMMGA